MTLENIAKLAGVSKTTVSRVINNKPDVNPETKKQILEIIDKYDFQPNAFAKAISSKKSNNIGLIIPHEADYIFSNPFYVEVFRGVSTEINRRGYYLLICYPHDNNYLDIYKQKRVDGFILMSPGSLHKNIVKSLFELNAPLISTARLPDEPKLAYIDVDNYYGSTLVMDYLLSLGHHKIAFFGKPNLTSSQDRLLGYQDCLAKNQIPYDEALVKVCNSSSIKCGGDTMNDLLEHTSDLTAVFCSNDLIAIGAMNAIREHGLRIPEDISVVGFDDVPLSRYITPSLTSVKQPAYEKGVKAAEALINFLENDIDPKSYNLNLELVKRKSTAPCRRLLL